MVQHYLLHWMELLGLFMVLQAFFINGVHTSMAGETETLPDGSTRDSEMIFYPFKKWLTRKRVRWVAYRSDELTKLIEWMGVRYAKGMPTGINIYSDYVEIPDPLQRELMKQILRGLGEEKKILGHWVDKDSMLVFGKEIDYPILSKWIRKPLGDCIKCMASFYGSLTYWPVVLVFYGWHPWELAVWVVDVVCLAFLNWYIYNLVK